MRGAPWSAAACRRLGTAPPEVFCDKNKVGQANCVTPRRSLIPRRRQAAALQGAFGTQVFKAVAHARRLTGTQKP